VAIGEESLENTSLWHTCQVRLRANSETRNSPKVPLHDFTSANYAGPIASPQSGDGKHTVSDDLERTC